MDFFLKYIFIPLIAFVLIIINEWVKRGFEKRKSKIKYKKWEILFENLKTQGTSINLDSIDSKEIWVYYELLKDGLIEVDPYGGITLKRASIGSSDF